MQKLITANELCELLSIQRQTLYRWRKEGLPTIKGIRAIRFNYDDVLAWLVNNGKDYGK